MAFRKVRGFSLGIVLLESVKLRRLAKEGEGFDCPFPRMIVLIVDVRPAAQAGGEEQSNKEYTVQLLKTHLLQLLQIQFQFDDKVRVVQCSTHLAAHKVPQRRAPTHTYTTRNSAHAVGFVVQCAVDSTAPVLACASMREANPLGVQLQRRSTVP